MNDVSLKAKIRNKAKERNISAQALLQNFLMRRFLFRLSQTEYRNKFVIKGGMLISSIVGIEHRSTMDIDATLKDLPLTEDAVINAFNTICSLDTDDNISFKFGTIDPIRDDDEYGGYRIAFSATFGKINAPMSMDISTGDIITPSAEKHTFSDMFDKTVSFDLWAYSVETILAEKVETILSRGTENTRPRDFYDVYVLSTEEYNKKTFEEAFVATATHRDSIDKIKDYESIIKEISQSKEMNSRWIGYTKLMPYAQDIEFNETLNAVLNLLR